MCPRSHGLSPRPAGEALGGSARLARGADGQEYWGLGLPAGRMGEAEPHNLPLCGEASWPTGRPLGPSSSSPGQGG